MTAGYDKLVAALKERLQAKILDAHGRETGFIRRLRTVGASDFVWAVVLSRFATGVPGFDRAREIFIQLSETTIWPRPFQIRFKSEAAVDLMAAAFESAVKRWRGRRRIEHPLAKYFEDIVAIDSTIIQLNDRLRRVFPGHMQAAAELKATLAISIFGLVPLFAQLTSRKIHDSKLFPALSGFRRGSLLLFDNAYAPYGKLHEIAEAGMYYVATMRVHAHARILSVRRAPKHVRARVAASPDGISLREVLKSSARVRSIWDLDVTVHPRVGSYRQPIPMRLVIRPGRKHSYYYLTNVGENWSAEAIPELYRLRWQIELVNNELKQHLALESVPTKDPKAAQVFVWASLIALTVSRTVAIALTPLRQLNGLAAKQSVRLTSRALRACLAAFVSRLAPRRAIDPLLDAVRAQATRRGPPRADSFHRLIPMLPA